MSSEAKSTVDQDVNSGDGAQEGGSQPEAATPQLTAEDWAKQVGELKNDLLYQRAEFDNFKKRLQREKQEFLKYATENLLREILPVLDNFELGFRSVDQDNFDPKIFVEGMKLNNTYMMQVLERFGLKKIAAEGQKFDPNFHDAVDKQGDSPVDVVSVQQTGYLLHERVLRPARVVVGQLN